CESRALRLRGALRAQMGEQSTRGPEPRGAGGVTAFWTARRRSRSSRSRSIPGDGRGALGKMAGSTFGAAGANDEGPLGREGGVTGDARGRNRPDATINLTRGGGAVDKGRGLGVRHPKRRVQGGKEYDSRVRGMVRAAPGRASERTLISVAPSPVGLLALKDPGGIRRLYSRENGTSPAAAIESPHVSAVRRGSAPSLPPDKRPPLGRRGGVSRRARQEGGSPSPGVALSKQGEPRRRAPIRLRSWTLN
ncbi:hypothetical protein THAOC_19103, partial [Thalassiosira oceanica]